ncbi:MAG: ABC-F family ATP-binding cassette domain-containing protein [Clostridiales bacterium]|nr:ABC-F family ATP-binding cassette domain-containing protein [Clostridiales bacterium]
MQLNVRDLSFTYEGSYTPVFNHVSFHVDTSWRLGLLGRNGRGKTTLLRLMQGLHAFSGHIDLSLQPVYFPFEVADPEQLTLFVMQAAAPEAEDWQLIRECSLLQLTDDAIYRPFSTLSRGEQTKALLAALFAREDVYPLIDEPTNHLDAHGRELVADYLRRKDGFLLVSHDRAFLNRCIDHVLSLNKSDIWVMQGNYDTWEERLTQQNAYEQARNEDLKHDIRRLEESARRMATWSDRLEATKIGTHAADRGAIGAQAAAMMKKSLNVLHRRERAIEEKRTLLHNVEKVGELKLTNLRHPKSVLIDVQEGQVRYGDRIVADGVSFQLRQGDRAALTGPNGSGKSSILKALCGTGGALTGKVNIAGNLVISYVPQETDSLHGDLREFIQRSGVDETLFKAILRNMDFGRELFDQPIHAMSQGQKKKLLLARSLCIPAHLYVWDEPLNYIDVYSRKQVEALIAASQPTLLVVEHDAVFLENVCTRPAIELKL